MIAAERGATGTRLVAIDERGDRRFEVVRSSAAAARDDMPAISPDGRWLVFASSRERGLRGGTSLWIAPLARRASPRRLTGGPAIDLQPAWTPDGRAVVYASRTGAEFDLWRLAITADGRAAGPPERLTSTPGHELTPTVAPDGGIAYTRATEQTSHIEERAPTGEIRALTGGPRDAAPAFSPDGRWLAFTRGALHDGHLHTELYRMARGADASVQLVDLPITDELSPAWSHDGSVLFATSIFRGDGERPLASSLIFIDLTETPMRARILRDSAGPVDRMSAALARAPLDRATLRADPEYLPELARIMASKIERATP